ncbi:hypothetical protein E2C01_078095 [Portunus trituberculatus]|uniref:Uncharacterized protein n=1 Tax=Portunus trituberculatus TaxID=210409 RepID=A0A5B7IP09_PORTR|nr:hypothetical protein [Portunus trituberculatus]
MVKAARERERERTREVRVRVRVRAWPGWRILDKKRCGRSGIMGPWQQYCVVLLCGAGDGCGGGARAGMVQCGGAGRGEGGSGHFLLRRILLASRLVSASLV